MGRGAKVGYCLNVEAWGKVVEFVISGKDENAPRYSQEGKNRIKNVIILGPCLVGTDPL